MQHPGVVQCDPARPHRHRHGARDIHRCSLDIDRAHEDAVLVVIQNGPAVRAGQHEEAAVLERAVVQGEARCQQVIVGMRIEGKILMPLHG